MKTWKNEWKYQLVDVKADESVLCKSFFLVAVPCHGFVHIVRGNLIC